MSHASLPLKFIWIVTLLVTEASADTTFQDIQPIFTKYCAGCHNGEESNGGLALDDYAAIRKGGDSGPAVTPGSAASSALVQMLTGKTEPRMPPEDEPRPSDQEIRQLIDWINDGAAGPQQASGRPNDQPLPFATSIPPAEGTATPVTAIAFSPDGDALAVARFETIELWSADGTKQTGVLSDLPGKVNSLAFSYDGRYLLAGTGVSGLKGEAILWRIADGKIVRRYGQHRDILYAAAISPNGRFVATAGYDRRLQISDFDTAEIIRKINGHNGAVYDLAFDPDSKRMSTASADATIKVWRVDDGMRLDTRSEPLKEQHSTAISPDGTLLAGAGADNRLRIWRLVSLDHEEINPLLFARYAHERAIEVVRFTPDGTRLVSVGRDGWIKIWSVDGMRLEKSLPKQTVGVDAIAISRRDSIALGRMNGTFEVFHLAANSLSDAPGGPPSDDAAAPTTLASQTAAPNADIDNQNAIDAIDEREPNDGIANSQAVLAPFEVRGHIHHVGVDGRSNGDGSDADVDVYRFQSEQGQRWVMTVDASRRESKLDSKIEVLDAQGKPVPRVLLQAVRDSYFTFRGKNSTQIGDFRLHNWQEMSLDQLLYCNGEVVKLYHYPRGPDSGFNVYPNFGSRHTFFDTPALAHALHEPCYIVEPHLPGASLPNNGLPSFTIYYENDDDSQRTLGADSRLHFVAPVDGEYCVRVSDVRGFEGKDYHYRLSVKEANPRFTIKKVHESAPKVPRGSGRKFGIEIERFDGFSDPVDIEIDDLPDGLTIPGPLTVERDQYRVWAQVRASADASEQVVDQAEKPITVRAVAQAHGRRVEEEASLGKPKLTEPPKLLVQLTADVDDDQTPGTVPVIMVKAGGTTTARLTVERNGYEGRVNFGKEEAAVNLPHGVYVDNTGLNGVLIPEGQTERIFFITAEPWVQSQERVIFLEAEEAGRPTSNPAILRVVGNENLSASVQQNNSSKDR